MSPKFNAKYSIRDRRGKDTDPKGKPCEGRSRVEECGHQPGKTYSHQKLEQARKEPPLEPSRSMALPTHLFFWPQELGEKKNVSSLRHWVFGPSLQQLQKTRTHAYTSNQVPWRQGLGYSQFIHHSLIMPDMCLAYSMNLSHFYRMSDWVKTSTVFQALS